MHPHWSRVPGALLGPPLRALLDDLEPQGSCPHCHDHCCLSLTPSPWSFFHHPPLSLTQNSLYHQVLTLQASPQASQIVLSSGRGGLEGVSSCVV